MWVLIALLFAADLYGGYRSGRAHEAELGAEREALHAAITAPAPEPSRLVLPPTVARRLDEPAATPAGAPRLAHQ